LATLLQWVDKHEYRVLTLRLENKMAKFTVQISYVTKNGGRTTTNELIEALDKSDAKEKAVAVAAQYNQGRVVSIGQR